MINTCNKRCLEQMRLGYTRRSPSNPQPDHLGKAQVPDELLDRCSTKGNFAWFHVYD
jgi:hypothetical protein